MVKIKLRASCSRRSHSFALESMRYYLPLPCPRAFMQVIWLYQRSWGSRSCVYTLRELLRARLYKHFIIFDASILSFLLFAELMSTYNFKLCALCFSQAHLQDQHYLTVSSTSFTSLHCSYMTNSPSPSLYFRCVRTSRKITYSWLWMYENILKDHLFLSPQITDLNP